MSLAVVIPAAPRDNIMDTLDSVRHYLPASCVVVINDGTALLNDSLRRFHGKEVVLPSLPFRKNSLGGLWMKLAYAFRYVLENTDAEYILRLDADALIIRRGLSDALAEAFEREPKVGLLGSWSVGPDGAKREFGSTARGIRREELRFFVPRREVGLGFRSVLQRARRNGYEEGEHALACATFLRRAVIADWEREGWLSGLAMNGSRLTDDAILAVLTRASGWRLGNAGGPGDLVAVRWSGLPDSPAALAAGRAFVTHSVRHWGVLDEESIRKEFRMQRALDRSTRDRG